MRVRILLWICLTALVLVSASGCSDGFPTGAYKTGLGFYQMVFDRDGTVTVRDATSDSVLDGGTYAVQGAEVTFETSKLCDSLGAGPATYTWSLEEDALTLTPVGEDTCADRARFLDQPWYRVP